MAQRPPRVPACGQTTGRRGSLHGRPVAVPMPHAMGSRSWDQQLGAGLACGGGQSGPKGHREPASRLARLAWGHAAACRRLPPPPRLRHAGDRPAARWRRALGPEQRREAHRREPSNRGCTPHRPAVAQLASLPPPCLARSPRPCRGAALERPPRPHPAGPAAQFSEPAAHPAEPWRSGLPRRIRRGGGAAVTRGRAGGDSPGSPSAPAASHR